MHQGELDKEWHCYAGKEKDVCCRSKTAALEQKQCIKYVSFFTPFLLCTGPAHSGEARPTATAQRDTLC